jgi:hypothetical protein
MSVWDDPDTKVNNDFVKFDKVGDRVDGVIQSIRKHQFEDGSIAPQILLTLDDGSEKTLTVGQVKLKIAMSEQRPEVGDHISVVLTQIEKRGGGRTLKHFNLTVKRGERKADDLPPF